jgi:DNA polymerase III delta prime subunit
MEANNLQALNAELDWLQHVIDQVIASYLKHEGHEKHWRDIPAPVLPVGSSTYADTVQEWNLDVFERVVLALALAPHIRPECLDIFFGSNAQTERAFTEFGGITEKGFSGFLPTGQTLVFIVSANDPPWRVDALRIFSTTHCFAKEQVISLERTNDALPHLSGILTLAENWLHYFLTGTMLQPELSPTFPASPIQTPLEWQDLVLDYHVREQVDEISTWLKHGDTLMQEWGLAKKVKPGYRALFYGPPGTGKTLTASLLGKHSGREVYRVDVSMIVSKWIGETEKNLGKVFDAASYKKWILFFDEADALFGKRTASHSSNDRHANQQTGYLLQRIEDISGTVILSTNLKANMDEAFTRRFQSMIHFAMPNAAQREQLWRKAFAGVCELESDIDLAKIAQDYELAGGAIINVLRHCALKAIQQEQKTITRDTLLVGIRREFKKDNKTL